MYMFAHPPLPKRWFAPSKKAIPHGPSTDFSRISRIDREIFFFFIVNAHLPKKRDQLSVRQIKIVSSGKINIKKKEKKNLKVYMLNHSNRQSNDMVWTRKEGRGNFYVCIYRFEKFPNDKLFLQKIISDKITHSFPSKLGFEGCKVINNNQACVFRKKIVLKRRC